MPSTQNNKSIETKTLNIQARFAHQAMAQQVEAQGHPLARLVYDACRRFNDQFFGGSLLPCMVEITPPASMHALADYRTKSFEGVESHIRIGAQAAARGERYALDVLLHEMVHAYCFEVLNDLEPGYAGHGPKWTAQCNRIGRMLGLPEVFTKGRGGPNSARWPLCVRPAGYYGEAGDEAEQKKRTRTTRKRTAAPAVEKAPIDILRDELCDLVRQADEDTLAALVEVFASRRH